MRDHICFILLIVVVVVVVVVVVFVVVVVVVVIFVVVFVFEDSNLLICHLVSNSSGFKIYSNPIHRKYSRWPIL